MHVELNYDLINEIVVSELKDSIRMTLDEPYELYFDTQKAYDLVDSMLITLEYFMMADDFDDFVASLPEKEDTEVRVITVSDVVENEDGSADVSFDIPSKDIPSFVSAGVNFVLIKSIFGNPSDSELIRWIERGKQEERVDSRAEQLMRDLEDG